jgi:hypothetical protein
LVTQKKTGVMLLTGNKLLKHLLYVQNEIFVRIFVLTNLIIFLLDTVMIPLALK